LPDASDGGNPVSAPAIGKTPDSGEKSGSRGLKLGGSIPQIPAAGACVEKNV